MKCKGTISINLNILRIGSGNSNQVKILPIFPFKLDEKDINPNIFFSDLTFMHFAIRFDFRLFAEKILYDNVFWDSIINEKVNLIQHFYSKIILLLFNK